MSFGTELWDKVKLVGSYSEHAIWYMDKTNDFLKDIVAAEQEYAKSVIRASKAVKEEFQRRQNDKSDFMKSMYNLPNYQALIFCLGEVEALGNSNIEFANKLDLELRKDLKAKRKELETLNLKAFEEIEKSKNEMVALVDNVDRTERMHERAVKDMELALVTLQGAKLDPKKSLMIEKLTADHEKKCASAHDAAADFTKAIKIANEFKNKHYTQVLPTCLYSIQQNDEHLRVDATKATFIAIINAELERKTALELLLLRVKTSFEKVSGESDTAYFAATQASGETLPGDIAVSGSQKEDAEQRAAIRSGHASNSSTRDSIDSEQEIINLGAKKGRKKALDRVAILDKEIIEVQRKEHGIETLIQVDSGKAEKSLQAELEGQRRIMQARREAIMMKRHQLLAFVATIDGKPAPEAPKIGEKYTSSPVTASPDKNRQSILSLTAASAAVPVAKSLPSVGSVPAPPPPPPRAARSEDTEQQKVKVMYDFDGLPGSSEMSVRVGMELVVLSGATDGWIKCLNEDGVEGLVPESYVSSD